ncbi:hypothetical protein [Bacillus sp. 1006-3]|uniref:hypothetical protein n=1 Tax=Bacillus sp. 1006-3 TaxID=2922309 RepID=UPI001F0D5F93|nr:hypothetical protein [Bacillus sp. 1006-3]MCH4866678.1 hypothetical protein [Bacillus sp. 1006-3]
MSEAVGKWLTVFFAMIIISTPIMFYIDDSHKEAVSIVLNEGAKRASIDGGYTQSTINDMKTQLENKYKIGRGNVSISADTGSKKFMRGEYITASITIPRSPIFLVDIFAKGKAVSSYTKTIKVMSEYQEPPTLND